MSKVSVIIPTYNRSSLVKQAIESVLQQSFIDFEVIIVDDGSTDDTRSIIKRISDTRIKYLHKNNGGLSSARNIGLVNAKGEYVALLDDDDLWPSNYLEIMINRLQSQIEYGAAYARVMIISDDGRTETFARDGRYKSGWLTKTYFKGGPCIIPSATLFTKEVLERFYFDEALRTNEDHDAFLRLSLKTPFLFVPEANIFRRETPGSLSKSLTMDDQCNVILAFERFYYCLGGDKFVPSIVARRSISHKYRRAGKIVAQAHNRTAAITLFERGIRYYLLDIRLYFDLFKALLLSKKKDPNPAWKMPKPLPPHITVSCGTKSKERKSFTEQ